MNDVPLPDRRLNRPPQSPGGYLLVLAIAAGMINFVISPFARAIAGSPGWSLAWSQLITGAVIGEFVALTLWLVWGAGSFLHRQAIHWLIAAGLYMSFWFGWAAAYADLIPAVMSGPWLMDTAYGACLISPASLAAQAPLWPLRTHFGWRVERSEPTATAEPQSLSIFDILCGTAVVAVTLGLVRAIQQLDGGSFVWAELAIGLGAVLLMSLLVGLPSLIFLLRWNRVMFGTGVLAVYITGGQAALLVALWMFVGNYLSAADVLGWFIGGFACVATVAAPLLALRHCGYRLTWPRDRARGW